MSRFWIKPLLGAVALCLGTAGLGAQERTDLTIVVQNIKNASGIVRLALWGGAEGFTVQEKALVRLVQPAVAGALAFRFDGLKPGIYALATYHDENGNSEMDRTWLGLPDEGLAFSNGAWIKFGPPSFEEAAFEVRPEPQVVTVSLRY